MYSVNSLVAKARLKGCTLRLFLFFRIVTGLFEIVLVPLLVVLGMDQKIGGIEGALSKVVVSIALVILYYQIQFFV